MLLPRSSLVKSSLHSLHSPYGRRLRIAFRTFNLSPTEIIFAYYAIILSESVGLSWRNRHYG